MPHLRITAVWFITLSLMASPARSEPVRGTIPVIYSSDLFHPHVDPDDHFDLALLFALPEFDIRAMIFDLGSLPNERAGIVTLRQMMHLTGREVPHALGLPQELRSLNDTGLNQLRESQEGVRLLLETLRSSDKPVTIIQTGSLRDVAAAFNREPELMREKVARIYMNAGHSSGGNEYNVQLDVHAFVRVLRSGLPIYWGPCFGDDPYFTHWKFQHRTVLESTAPVVQNFFLYALNKTSTGELDPIDALTQPVDPESKRRFWELERNMWCTGTFLHAAGRTVIRSPDVGWSAIPVSAFETVPDSQHPDPPIFSYEAVNVGVSDDGTTHIGNAPGAVRILTYRRCDGAQYNEALRSVLRHFLEALESQ